MQMLKQISTATVFGDKAAIQRLVLSDQAASHFLYRVFGEITGYVVGDSKFQRIDPTDGTVSQSKWTKFAGEFFAHNNRQEEYEAAIAFMPEYISGPFVSALQDNPTNTLGFAFDVYAKYNAKSATSYEFIAQPIRSRDGSSKAERLRAAMPPLPGTPTAPAIAPPVAEKPKGK